MVDFWETRLILKTYAGSHSYGTNMEGSDEDFRGVCIPPESYLLGLDKFEQKEQNTPIDQVIYSLEKFIKLALANNPNILDVLFVRENHIVFINDFGKELRDLRYDFLSKNVYKTYGGYAISQLKKMTSIKKDSKDISGNRLGDFEKYGYSTKNAMHLIRLLRMGIEILVGGEVNVLRHDNQELLQIRRGEFSLNDIKAESVKLRNLLDEAYVRSTLPSKPNYDKINEWIINIHKRSLEWK